jgi:hypothetical protein
MSPTLTKDTAIPACAQMSCVLAGRRYSTSAARQIAYTWMPGLETRYYSTARRLHLFVTNKGNYFCLEQETMAESDEIGPFGWSGIRPLTHDEALDVFLSASQRLATVEEAFGDSDIDA